VEKNAAKRPFEDRQRRLWNGKVVSKEEVLPGGRKTAGIATARSDRGSLLNGNIVPEMNVNDSLFKREEGTTGGAGGEEGNLVSYRTERRKEGNGEGWGTNSLRNHRGLREDPRGEDHHGGSQGGRQRGNRGERRVSRSAK